MNSKKFSEAMGELDSKYVDEAINYKKKSKKPGWAKWGAFAACLCLVICAFAIPRLFEKPDNSASGDLSSMIYVNDTLYQITSDQPDLTGKESQLVYLGTISSKVSSSQYPKENFQANDDIVGSEVYQFGEDIVVEIDGQYWIYCKKATKTIDAGESSPLTKEIINLLPDNKEPIETPAQVASEQIRELTPTMTREEVLSFLGDTQDIGSGIYVYVYEVDGEYLLRISFASDDAQLGVTGENLLKALTPIFEDIDSNETVEFNGQLFNKSDLTEETLEWLEWYNSLSPEEQLAISSVPADLYTYDSSGAVDAAAGE